MTERDDATLRESTRKAVEAAPPLSAEVRDRIAEILRPAVERARADLLEDLAGDPCFRRFLDAAGGDLAKADELRRAHFARIVYVRRVLDDPERATIRRGCV